MKKINIILLSILALAIIVYSCQDDDLPTANFDLNAVTTFSGEIAHESVDLAWVAPAGNIPLQGYILEWTPNGDQVNLESSVTSYEVTGLENGTNYSFSIQANYGEAKTSGMNEIQLTPQDELGFAVLPGNKFAIAVWETPTRNDISGYALSWEPNGQEATISVETNSYQITGLENDVEYTFNFNIIYSDGNNSEIVQALATPGEISAFLLDNEFPMTSQEVQLTYNSAFLPNSDAVSWNWDFGDGSNSTDENPTHAFSNPGAYDVQLQIVDDQGFNFSDTRTVYVWGEKWSYTIGSRIKPQIPAIADDGTIYIGSDDNNNFHAISPDGTLKWTYMGITDNVYSSASIGSDGTIYVGAKDSFLHAINPDGTQKWTFNMGGDPIFASPAIADDGTIYIGSDADDFFAVNPDGTQKWVFTTSGFNIRSTPAIATDGTVYIASDDDNLYALNPSDGSVLWSFAVGGDVEGAVAIDSDGSIIVSVDQGSASGSVYAINPDGTQKWNTTTSGRMLSSPAIANGTIYVGTKDSDKLLAFSASNGSPLWEYIAGDIILSSPSVDKNGVIYFGSFDDHVYVVNPDGTEKYKFDTGDNVWSSAVIGNDGTVYIGGYDGKLHAFEFFAEGLATDVWPMFQNNLKHTGRQ